MWENEPYDNFYLLEAISIAIQELPRFDNIRDLELSLSIRNDEITVEIKFLTEEERKEILENIHSMVKALSNGVKNS